MNMHAMHFPAWPRARGAPHHATSTRAMPRTPCASSRARTARRSRLLTPKLSRTSSTDCVPSAYVTSARMQEVFSYAPCMRACKGVSAGSVAQLCPAAAPCRPTGATRCES